MRKRLRKKLGIITPREYARLVRSFDLAGSAAIAFGDSLARARASTQDFAVAFRALIEAERMRRARDLARPE